MLFRLSENPHVFPDPELADPDGLLALGGDLSVPRLVAAYRAGIFPWFNEPPYLWWSPDPRGVIVPHSLHIPRRLQRSVAAGGFRLTMNTAFADVCRLCAHSPRPDQRGTWITAAMRTAYEALHQHGVAHSVELWDGPTGTQLLGGMYGVLVGRVFCGESMFYLQPNASKLVFAWFAQRFFAAGGVLIDCQQLTPHMIRFGAIPMSRTDFLAVLAEHAHAGAAFRLAIFAPKA